MQNKNHSENQSQNEFDDENTDTDIPKNKLIKSRNAWKQRAQEHAQAYKHLQEQVRNLTESRDTWKAKALERKELSSKEIESLNKENQALQIKLQRADATIENLKKKPK